MRKILDCDRCLFYAHNLHLVCNVHPEGVEGDRFTVSRHGETKTIDLCGVKAEGDTAKNYLQTVLDKRDGEVFLERSGDSYDAWITIEPDNAVGLLEDLPYEVEASPEINIHLNTWMLEQGYARRDEQSFEQCSQPEYLAQAEKVAKENKIGIWQGK